MLQKDKIIIGIYISIAILALIFTWYHNILFLKEGDNTLLDFIKATVSNDAATSIAYDILFLGLAVNIFMIVEAKRLNIKYVWAYIILSFLIAISVTVPIFLAVRHFKIAKHSFV
jgi:hypothetical protein